MSHLLGEKDRVERFALGEEDSVAHFVRDEAERGSAWLDTALTYVGVTEVGGDNRGPEVERFLAATGLPGGYAWCAAFVSYCLDAGGATWPETRSALAHDFITRRSIKASSVLMGIERPAPGSIVIWKKGNGRYGHAGYVIEQTDTGCFVTVEGNTSAPDGLPAADTEADRNGDGVYVRLRCIEPANYFRIVSFTEPEGL